MSKKKWEEDFGLGQDEQFEPDEIEETIDLRQPHVRTILGPIEPAALGLTLFVDGLEAIAGKTSEGARVLAELEAAYYVGLRGLAMTDPPGDTEPLKWLAARSPVHFVIPSRFIKWETGDAAAQQEYGKEPCILDIAFIESLASGWLLRSLRSDSLLAGVRGATAESRTLTNALHQIPLALMDCGFSAMDVRRILVQNPALVLAPRLTSERGTDR